MILVAPTHPGNVGAAARAMQAMGFEQLWIANAEDPKIHARADAVALSSGAARVLGGARHATLGEALAPATWSCAMSARIREFEPPRLSLEQACESVLAHIDALGSDQAAFVFGAERSGLTNDQLLSCRHVCSFDVEEKFSSLNLAQSVQVVAYALRRAARDYEKTNKVASDQHAARAGFAGVLNAATDPDQRVLLSGNNRETARPASHEAVAGLHEHLVRVALKVGYLDPASPGRFDERLKRLLARKDMWEDEVQMLRGLCTEIERRT